MRSGSVFAGEGDDSECVAIAAASSVRRKPVLYGTEGREFEAVAVEVLFFTIW